MYDGKNASTKMISISGICRGTRLKGHRENASVGGKEALTVEAGGLIADEGMRNAVSRS